jgi:hypothetical protein
MKVSAKYEVRDADQFRRLAGKLQHKIRFFPGYNSIKRGVPTWSPWYLVPGPKKIPLELFRKRSRIVPSFVPELRWNLPVTLMKASFQAHVLPDPPPGYRAWYRWICVFYISDTKTVRLRLRSLKYDKDEVFEYSDQDSVYIGQESADYINSRVYDIKKGEILCRVQIIPVDEAPDPDINGSYPSLLLKYECNFINAEFAKHNIDLSLIPP